MQRNYCPTFCEAVLIGDRLGLLRRGLVLGFCLALGLIPVAKASTEPLLVSQDHAWPPFAFLDGHGQPQGLLVDLWLEVGARLGREVVFVLADWPESIAQVRDARAQVHGGLIQSPERDQFFAFSAPLMPLAAFVFIASSMEVHGVTELAAAQIGVTEGSYELEFMRTHYPALEMRTYRNNDLLIRAAVQGEISAFVADYPVAMYLLERHAQPTDFRALQSLYSRELRAGVRHADLALLAELDQALAQFGPDDLSRLYSRWLRTETVAVTPVWFWPLLLLLAGGLLLSLMVGYLLLQRRQQQRLAQLLAARTSALAQSEARFRALVENANDIIYALSPQGMITYVSPNWTEILGHSAEEVIGQDIARFVHPEDLENCYRFLQLVLKSGRKQQGVEYRVRHQNGSWRWHISNASPQFDAQGNVEAFMGIARDVTERKQYEDKIRRLAHHDVLTDLPNRALFADRLQQALQRAKRNKERCALMVLDLNEFKSINDTYGHATGDRILQQAAQRISKCLRSSDTVARMGGDEFMVLLPVVCSISGATAVAEKISEQLSKPFPVGGRKLQVTASIGVAIYPDHGGTETKLLAAADLAMYAAKHGGARILLYEAEMQTARDQH